MRVLVITPRLGRDPWTTGPIVATVLRVIAEAGHEPLLAADSIEDAAMLGGASVVEAFRDFSPTSSDFPSGFPSWVREIANRMKPDRTLSLCRSVVGNACWPLEPTRGAWMRRVLGTKSPVGIAAHLAKHHAVVRPRGRRVIRGRAAANDPPIEIRPPGLTLLDRPSDEHRVEARGRVRDSLGIGHNVHVLGVSATSGFGRQLDAPLAGLALANSPTRPLAVLAMARDTFSLHAAVRRAENRTGAPLWPHMHVLPPTQEAMPVLAACDGVLAPLSAWGDGLTSGCTGRFLADALLMGVPVAAIDSASGADMLRLGLGPGFLVRASRPPGWRATVERLIALERNSQPARVPTVASALKGCLESWGNQTR